MSRGQWLVASLSAMSSTHDQQLDGNVKAVRESLAGYVERGVFRGFGEAQGRQGRTGFRFLWLNSRSFELSVDPGKHLLTFQRPLPGIPAKSALYAELKDFIRQRHAPELPEHRRIDPLRAEARCSTRRSEVSVSLLVKDEQYAYGVNRIVNLVHELFVHLGDAHPEYLVENFDVPQE